MGGGGGGGGLTFRVATLFTCKQLLRYDPVTKQTEKKVDVSCVLPSYICMLHHWRLTIGTVPSFQGNILPCGPFLEL